ncbi:hypothetical protein [Cytobacillus praedii]|uniref:hypothetical protein n=1 Tax=Cytobacillus praedii TaxID=1742358 RepID=UPI002E22A361|nr:hypothetical protein [Cytobacillus praedii]
MATVGNFANTIGTTHVTAVKILNGLVRRVLIIAKSSDLALFNYKGKGDPWQAFLLWGHLLDDALQPIPEELLAHFEVGIGSIIYPMQKEGHLIVSKPF